MNVDVQKMANNVKLNREILALLGFEGTGKDGPITDHIWSDRFCVWKDCIQDSFDDVPAWNAEKLRLSQEFGWTIDRLQKNPMLLEAALDAIYKKSPIKILDQLCEAILGAFEPK